MTETNGPTVAKALWRFRWSAAAIVLGCALLAGGVGMATGSGVQVEAVLALATPRPSGVISAGSLGDASLARYTAQRARFLTSDQVLGAVAESLDESNLNTLRARISVAPSSSSNIIMITTRGDDAEEAVQLAEALTRAYSEQTRAEVERLTTGAIESIQREIESIQATVDALPGPASSGSAATTLSELQLRANSLAVDAAIFADGVDFVVAPHEDAASGGGLPLRDAALGGIVGLVLASTISWIRADRDRAIGAPLQAEAVLQAPLLGELKSTAGPVSGSAYTAAVLDRDYELIWSTLRPILRVLNRVPGGVLLINSSERDLATATAVGLARAAAREDPSVLLVDGDPEGAGLTELLDLSDREGLSDLISQGGDHNAHLVDLELDDHESVAVLPAGKRDRDRMSVSALEIERYVMTWRKQFELVLIDANLVGAHQLPSVMSGVVDGVLFVVSNGTDERALEEYERWVRLHGSSIVGYVYADARRKLPPWYR